MKKIMTINGMQCEHCKMSVEKALIGVAGVNDVKVDLKKKNAVVTLGEAVEDNALKDAVTAAGFEVVEVKEKKGIFG